MACYHRIGDGIILNLGKLREGIINSFEAGNGISVLKSLDTMIEIAAKE